MARITVEDCIKQVNNQYDLVILAKERAVQLGRGAAPAVDPENDKKPVIALREIGESKVTPEELQESIVSKLRQIPDYQEEEELEEVDNDTFRQMYQGGLSKSEMEKSATRKFTARSPRNETRVKPLEEQTHVTDLKNNDESIIEDADQNDNSTDLPETIDETAPSVEEILAESAITDNATPDLNNPEQNQEPEINGSTAQEEVSDKED
tara:strand:- start:242 stop:868 length:627 start_codon:yes stop_codon:yes gene_type:complete